LSHKSPRPGLGIGCPIDWDAHKRPEKGYHKQFGAGRIDIAQRMENTISGVRHSKRWQETAFWDLCIWQSRSPHASPNPT
jgi:hypothetical protein